MEFDLLELVSIDRAIAAICPDVLIILLRYGILEQIMTPPPGEGGPYCLTRS